MTFGQFFAVWCRAPAVVAGLDMDHLRTQIAARRAELGLPPVKPAPKRKR